MNYEGRFLCTDNKGQQISSWMTGLSLSKMKLVA